MPRGLPRKLEVIIYRLRLGYNACWEIIHPEIRNCTLCETATEYPLLHYLLYCPETNALRRNLIIPQDIQSDEALHSAVQIARTVTEDVGTYGSILMNNPPPR